METPNDSHIIAGVGGQDFAVIAPRVTLLDIEAAIVEEVFFTAAQGVVGASMAAIPAEPLEGQLEPLTQVTFCVMLLRNGTKIVGINYGSIDPAEHSAAQGRFEARAHAIEQIWPLMGYALREELAHGTRIKGTVEYTTD
jgi:hypothetical protein